MTIYTEAALSFGLIRACSVRLVLYSTVLSDAGGEEDESAAISERSLLPRPVVVLCPSHLLTYRLHHWPKTWQISTGVAQILRTDFAEANGRFFKVSSMGLSSLGVVQHLDHFLICSTWACRAPPPPPPAHGPKTPLTPYGPSSDNDFWTATHVGNLHKILFSDK